MSSLSWQSWGNYPLAKDQAVTPLEWRQDPLPSSTDQKLLPRGLGRSYGDVCLNSHGVLLDTHHLNHFLAFDPVTGLLRAEAGISFEEILNVVVPQGWFLPVTPGTKHVTLGGAIANDIHGKNHHVAGTIGCHIRQLELRRSTGETLRCSESENKELFHATVGGLGLTGLITWAEFQLLPIKSSLIEEEALPFFSLKEFFAINDDSDKKFTYTVAWIDTTSSHKTVRGIFFRGNHASQAETPIPLRKSSPFVRVPLMAPSALLNPISMRAFNTSYVLAHRFKKGVHLRPYDPFFYPLDVVQDWNKLYGRPGFLQYQFVVPREAAMDVVPHILHEAKRTQTVAFLSVLKTFGERRSPGILSFPRPGITMALDVRYRGQKTLETLNAFDEIILAHGGRLYPAKDARMSPETFRACYPEVTNFLPWIDPAFSSQFWRRVMS